MPRPDTEPRMTPDELIEMRTALWDCMLAQCEKFQSKKYQAFHVVPEIVTALVDLSHHLSRNNLGLSDDLFLLMCKQLIMMKAQEREKENGATPAANA